MTDRSDSDLILNRISRLTALTPDPGRAERLRARCRARMARPVSERPRVVVPALLAGVGALYLSAVAANVLRLRGMF